MSKYINWFIKKSKIARDLLKLELFPNVKEVQESYGMFCACRKIIFDLKDESVLCIVVGDGARPRTGCTIVFNSLWSALSIDPALKKLKPSLIKKLKKVKRFDYIPYKIEEIINQMQYQEDENKKYKTLIYLHPHSHALLSDTLCFHNIFFKKYNFKTWLISMPCCVKDNLHMNCYSYVDNFIHSEKNRINIYPIQNANLKELNI